MVGVNISKLSSL